MAENRDKLDQLAEKLLEKEVIFKEDLLEIFGKRPWDKEVEMPEEKTDTPAETEESSNTEN